MIDKDAIENIARLARLEVGPQEIEELRQQMSKALKYFEQISKIDTTNIKPLITPTEIETYWREDKVEQTTTTEEILENAPDKVGRLFRVPPVV